MKKIEAVKTIPTAVKNLKEGNQIELEDGNIVKIVSIKKGMTGRNSKLISYSNGEWNDLFDTDIVNVVPEAENDNSDKL